MILTAENFFKTDNYIHKELFEPEKPVWDGLSRLKHYMNEQSYLVFPLELIKNNQPLARTVVYFENSFIADDHLTIELGDAVKGKLKVYRKGRELPDATVIMAGVVLSGYQFQFGKGVLIESGTFLKSPVIVGDRTEIRQGAYLRGYCLIGNRCVVGHVTEVKHTIFLDDAKAGHFAYLGDSILGNQVNLGAGTKLANLRFTSGNVKVKTTAGLVSTGLRKLGAVLGDKTQTGCNSVTNPGALLGKKCLVMPNSTVLSGYHGNNSLLPKSH